MFRLCQPAWRVWLLPTPLRDLISWKRNLQENVGLSCKYGGSWWFMYIFLSSNSRSCPIVCSQVVGWWPSTNHCLQIGCHRPYHCRNIPNHRLGPSSCNTNRSCASCSKVQKVSSLLCASYHTVCKLNGICSLLNLESLVSSVFAAFWARAPTLKGMYCNIVKL